MASRHDISVVIGAQDQTAPAWKSAAANARKGATEVEAATGGGGAGRGGWGLMTGKGFSPRGIVADIGAVAGENLGPLNQFTMGMMRMGIAGGLAFGAVSSIAAAFKYAADEAKRMTETAIRLNAELASLSKAATVPIMTTPQGARWQGELEKTQAQRKALHKERLDYESDYVGVIGNLVMGGLAGVQRGGQIGPGAMLRNFLSGAESRNNQRRDEIVTQEKAAKVAEEKLRNQIAREEALARQQLADEQRSAIEHARIAGIRDDDDRRRADLRQKHADEERKANLAEQKERGSGGDPGLRRARQMIEQANMEDELARREQDRAAKNATEIAEIRIHAGQKGFIAERSLLLIRENAEAAAEERGQNRQAELARIRDRFAAKRELLEVQRDQANRKLAEHAEDFELNVIQDGNLRVAALMAQRHAREIRDAEQQGLDVDTIRRRHGAEVTAMGLSMSAGRAPTLESRFLTGVSEAYNATNMAHNDAVIVQDLLKRIGKGVDDLARAGGAAGGGALAPVEIPF